MPEEPQKTIAEFALRVAQNEHASIVMRCVGILDYDLERCLLVTMRSISSKLRTRIFSNYGPLSTFASKIDIGFALKVIDEESYEALGTIRSIRNKFAHSKERISLDRPPLLDLFNQLVRPTNAAGSYAEVFVECVGAIDDKLEQYLVSHGVTEDISAKNRPDSST